ncbi:MAG: hypothetical protein L0H10_01580 [Comamonas sp.]|uniref:hypothetical protein n=1 Tax=Comamonas sp. TaxID=34028 RepID=UPI002649E80E|nr:hypothetical protein [Comamonas sp.]MDN5502503.1 hypothetical protein [Comamonas sp.]MDN5535694.1 hypothetical protein [Comamonas sp.]
MSQNTFLDYVPSAIQGDADSVAAPGLVGAGGTLYQSIRKSSSRALLVGDLSGVSVHLNPGGAGGACGDGAAGSLNLASEIPSLTPALIAEYSTQYVSSIPMAAAMNGNSSPSPINPMVASPSVEAVDLKDDVAAPGRVGAGGTHRELTDAELASVLKSALQVVELRAVRRVIGVDEFKRFGLSIDLRLAERLVLIHADWLLEQGA